MPQSALLCDFVSSINSFVQQKVQFFNTETLFYINLSNIFFCRLQYVLSGIIFTQSEQLCQGNDLNSTRKLFFIFIALLLTIAAARMIFLAGSGGRVYRQESAKLSQRSGKLTAIRGRIFDRSDQLLAWSERCYDLVLQPGAVDDEGTAKIFRNRS